MKKVVISSAMFMTGIISAVVLLAGAMAYDYKSMNISPFAVTMTILARYGLTQFLYIAIVIAVVGIAVTIWGLFGKKED